MFDAHQILKRYWGYDSFRFLQEEVITSINSGKDTLALMPTGGGKSVCFQVPTMMKDGICIVISPLVALMKDQVQDLRDKNIKAISLNASMSASEVDIALDNCIYGNYKFLYISPERLNSVLLQSRLQKMNINLIAVDEAHCISQWGYDFRPSYLKIAEIRNITNAPILALTATATKDVVEDIQDKLLFEKKQLLKMSFARNNLSYVCLKHDDKNNKMISILNKIPGSAIIYCHSRKDTVKIHQWLTSNQISSHFYHAGLSMDERDKKQKQWQQNHVRIMVATNAFGMGINKADVRLVLHHFVPNSLESYFQQAGRAGRDQKTAYAVLMYNDNDINKLYEQLEKSYPKIDYIVGVYQKLSNFLSIAVGKGMDESFEFNLNEFCQKYQLDTIEAYNTIKLFEQEGLIKLNDGFLQPSKLYIKVNKSDLYQFQISHPIYDKLVKTLLRSYGSLFEEYTIIEEEDIARRTEMSIQDLQKALNMLKKLEIIEYLPKSDNPKILFTHHRVNAKSIAINSKQLEEKKKKALKKINFVTSYIKNNFQCRSSFLLNYFDEHGADNCGICDPCLSRNKKGISDTEFDEIAQAIKKHLLSKPTTLDELILSIVLFREDKMIKVLQFLSDNNQIAFNENKELYWII